MTAPALSPAEQEEALRFGIHDPIEDAIDELEEHFNDEVQCVRGQEPATVRLVINCCKHANQTYCEGHLTAYLDWVDKRLEAGTVLGCKSCGTRFRTPQTAKDIFTEVTL